MLPLGAGRHLPAGNQLALDAYGNGLALLEIGIGGEGLGGHWGGQKREGGEDE